jgi:hypothetical protein
MILRRRQLAAIILLAVLATACPSSNDLGRMAKASNELAHDTLLANNVVAEFYTSGKMPLTVKDKIAEKLGVLPPQDLAFVRENLSALRQLYADVVADLLPFGAQKAVKELDKDLTSIEKAVK